MGVFKPLKPMLGPPGGRPVASWGLLGLPRTLGGPLLGLSCAILAASAHLWVLLGAFLDATKDNVCNDPCQHSRPKQLQPIPSDRW